MITSSDIPDDHPSVEARQEWGRARRDVVPRRRQAEWEPPADRRDPVDILAGQNAGRVKHLVPLRHRRMLASPFTFYRGTAAIMAADLAATPVTGLITQICGDAHLANFGVFGSPERSLVFDLNDFDETHLGPWEWDVKRLAASAVLLAREHGWGRDVEASLAREVGGMYRWSMHQFAEAGRLDVWYSRLTDDDILAFAKDPRTLKRTSKVLAKARANDVRRAVEKFTEVVDGHRRIKDQPPTVYRIDEEFRADRLGKVRADVLAAFGDYLDTIPPHLQYLVSGYRLLDVAVKVVGVGSVGTRCLIALAEGRDPEDLFFFQVKEASPSVVAPFVDLPAPSPEGRRVVDGQHLMQAASDQFLGWASVGGHDFYFRQFRDMKGSFDLDRTDPGRAGAYLMLCAWTLARAHARSGDRIAIAGYLGNGDRFDRALADFSLAYAETVAADYERFRSACESGELPLAPPERG